MKFLFPHHALKAIRNVKFARNLFNPKTNYEHGGTFGTNNS
jgi:hypothetical protein